MPLRSIRRTPIFAGHSFGHLDSGVLPPEKADAPTCPSCGSGQGMLREGQKTPAAHVKVFCPSCGHAPADPIPSPHHGQFVALVKALHGAFEKHAQGQSTAIFFAQKQEHSLLVRLLMASVLNAPTAPGASPDAEHQSMATQCLHVLSRSPELIELPSHADITGAPAQQRCVVPSHCIILEQEARRLVALPVAGIAMFDDMCKHLLPDRPDDVPTIEHLYALWRHRFTVTRDQMREAVHSRLTGADNFLASLRGWHAASEAVVAARKPWSIADQRTSRDVLLPRDAPSLALRPENDISCAELSKLTFLTQCEAHSSHSELVQLRGAPLAHRLAKRQAKTRLLRLLPDQAGCVTGRNDRRFAIENVQVRIG